MIKKRKRNKNAKINKLIYLFGIAAGMNLGRKEKKRNEGIQYCDFRYLEQPLVDLYLATTFSCFKIISHVVAFLTNLRSLVNYSAADVHDI